MKTKNILIICPFFRPNIGGVETHLDLLTDYLAKHNYKTTVLTYKPLTTKINNYKKIEKTKNLIIYRFWWFGTKLFDKTTPYPLAQFFYIIPGLLLPTFLYLFKNHKKIDTIHAHGFAAAIITRFCSLFFKNIRLVVSTHYLYPNLDISKLSTKILKWTFCGFDQILTVSNQSSIQLQNIGLDKNKMIKYQHWLNPNIYFPLKGKILPKYKLSILFVGRTIKMKGVFNLLYAAKKLPSDILFTIIGDGPDFNQLKKESTKLKNFHIIGKKLASEIIPYYQTSDFTILPSIAPEAQPMTVMESLMCGTPVITTNKGSVTDMYSNLVGISINPTIDNLSKIIFNLYKNPILIKKMKSHCRSFAIKKYSFKNAKIITNSYFI